MSSSFTDVDELLTSCFGGVVGEELKLSMLVVVPVVSFAVTSDGNNDNDDNDKDVVDGISNFVCSSIKVESLRMHATFPQMGAS
jgi:hypothetical protein